MSIRAIEGVSINGTGGSLNRKLFGGYIYSLRYNVSMGGSEGKSSITATIVSETGKYSITKGDLGYRKIYNIKIGSKINVNMHLVRAKIAHETNSQILELKFSDTSEVLDQFQIGLYKKHGYRSEGNLIIVGREFHPCDRDYDGDIDSIPEISDDCHPCKNTSIVNARIQKINCEEITKYTLMDVAYNFSDLLKALKKSGLRVGEVKDPNPKFFSRFTGSIRDVLMAWCNEFGWIFYWENDTVKFLDLRKTIEIGAKISDFCPRLTSYTEEWSMEDTDKSELFTYFHRAGKNDDYNDCSFAKYANLAVYGPNTGGVSSVLDIVDSIDHVAAGLSYYSRALRDLWYYYVKYELTGPSGISAGKYYPKIGLRTLSGAITLNSSSGGSGGSLSSGGLTSGGLGSVYIEPSEGLSKPSGIPENKPGVVGALQSKAFLTSTVVGNKLNTVKSQILSNQNFKLCFESLPIDDQWTVANGLAKNEENYFFYIAYLDEDEASDYAAQERDYAQNFMNKYHIYQPSDSIEDKEFFEDYTYDVDNVCGASIRKNDNKISYDMLGSAHDASFRFFNNPGSSVDGSVETLSSLPFARFLKIFRESSLAPVAPSMSRMFKLVVVEKEVSFSPVPNIQEEDPNNRSLDPKDNINNKTLIDKVQKYAPSKISNKNDRKGENIPIQVLTNLNASFDKDIDKKKVFVILGKKVDSSFKVSSTNAINPNTAPAVPFDGSPIRSDKIGNNPSKIVYRYPDLACEPIGNVGVFSNKRNFNTPVGQFSYTEPCYGNYALVIEKKKNVTRFLDKLEVVNKGDTKANLDLARYSIKLRDITDGELNILKKRNWDSTCEYDTAAIKSYSQELSKNVSYEIAGPSTSISFGVDGIDINKVPKIGEGLISVDINMEESGIKTTYVLGTRLMKAVGDSFLTSFLQAQHQINKHSLFSLDNSPMAPANQPSF